MEVPPPIRRLGALTGLKLDNNDLDKIPPWLSSDLLKLKTLGLDQNPLQSPPLFEPVGGAQPAASMPEPPYLSVLCATNSLYDVTGAPSEPSACPHCTVTDEDVTSIGLAAGGC